MTRDEIVEAARRKDGPLENLKSCQRQLDMDGCEVGVSRQALDESDLVRQ